MPMLHDGGKDAKGFIQAAGDIRRAARKLVPQSLACPPSKATIEIVQTDRQPQAGTLLAELLEELGQANVIFNSLDTQLE